jgi:phospholipid transport system substrate-binding protein
MKLVQQLGICLIMVLCWGSIAHANVDDAQAGPRMAVETAASGVIDILEKEREVIRANPDKLYGLVNQHILPHFDFDKMSYFVLGKAWQAASAQQKADFQREFKHLLISTYTTALLEYDTGHKIVYKDVIVSPKNKNIAIVPTQIRQKGAGPINVSYRMIQANDSWKIYDVVIDGVSLVTNYRANFAGQVRSKGLDGLITSMGEHNEPKNTVSIKPVSQKQ